MSWFFLGAYISGMFDYIAGVLSIFIKAFWLDCRALWRMLP